MLVTFRARKAVFVCLVCIQDQGIDDFKNDQMKLSIQRSKIDWFVSQELCHYSTDFDLKFAFGPEKLSGLSRNAPLVLKEFAQNHRVRTES